MEFRRRIYGYCERGFEAGPGADAFWAEPWNAVTNGAFILAALIALVMALQARRLDGPVGWLITLTFVVGVGSFLFHTYAMVWAALTDTIPIMLFILSYFAISMRCYGGFGWGRSLMLMLAFLVILLMTSTVLRYGVDLFGVAYETLTATDRETYTREAGGAVAALVVTPLAAHFIAWSLLGASLARTGGIIVIWLAATIGLAELANTAFPELFRGMRSYFPALLALFAIGGWLWSRGHPAGRWLVLVGLVFAVSLTFRALDRPLCAQFLLGTHWVWHVLNGVVLGSLVVALIRHGLRPVSRA